MSGDDGDGAMFGEWFDKTLDGAASILGAIGAYLTGASSGTERGRR